MKTKKSKSSTEICQTKKTISIEPPRFKGRNPQTKSKKKLKNVVCQTSSSNFVCEMVKEEASISVSKVSNKTVPQFSAVNESKPLKNFNKNHSRSKTASSKSDADSQCIVKMSKDEASNIHKNHLSSLIGLSGKVDSLITNTSKSVKQHSQTSSAKPTIVKMSKKNLKQISPDKIWGPVDVSLAEKQNKELEQMSFISNVVKPIKTNFAERSMSGIRPSQVMHNILVEENTAAKTITRKSEENQFELDEMSSNAYDCSGLTMSLEHEDNSLPITDTNLPDDRIQIFKLSRSNYLVFMEPTSKFYFVGALELGLIKGHVEILGYEMKTPKQKNIVFSLQGSSHLYVRCVEGNSDPNLDMRSILTFFGIKTEPCLSIIEGAKSKTVLIVNRIKNHPVSTVWPDYFERHSLYSLFPAKEILKDESRRYHSLEYDMECIFDMTLNNLGLKEFNVISEWSDIANQISFTNHPRTVLCGGKSVGKSSLLRYFVNKSLSKWNKVVVIDFDIGQCEFTAPGCISVIVVETPLLGPNYTHLSQPSRSVFLGEIDVNKCPEPYIEGCKYLVEFAKQNYNDLPWFINTMGFTKGFGIKLTCGIISTVNPTHVVQIESQNRKINFPSSLDPGFVRRQQSSYSNLNYKLHVLHSGSDLAGDFSQNSKGMSPPEARNLVLLSYLSEMLSLEISDISQVVPYTVSIDNVTLLTTSQCSLTNDQIAMSMNGNLVALCSSEDRNFPNCLGFGIVRAIDWQQRTLFLVTPLSADRLHLVDCLVKGSVSLPDSLYLNPGTQVVGHVPYSAFTSSQDTSRFAKRDFRTLPTTRGQR